MDLKDVRVSLEVVLRNSEDGGLQMEHFKGRNMAIVCILDTGLGEKSGGRGGYFGQYPKGNRYFLGVTSLRNSCFLNPFRHIVIWPRGCGCYCHYLVVNGWQNIVFKFCFC